MTKTELIDKAIELIKVKGTENDVYYFPNDTHLILDYYGEKLLHKLHSMILVNDNIVEISTTVIADVNYEEVDNLAHFSNDEIEDILKVAR